MPKTILNDATIRRVLIDELARNQPPPRAVLEELRVHNGNAIADVVALFSEAHCYEIKGDTDKIDRIAAQSVYYNSSFRWITLVTTEGNRVKALRIAPRFWGILVASSANGQITLRSLRRAKPNPHFTKELALLTLWKSEMLSLVKPSEHQRQPRDVLAQIIAAAQKESELSSAICEALLTRHRTQFKATQ